MLTVEYIIQAYLDDQLTQNDAFVYLLSIPLNLKSLAGPHLLRGGEYNRLPPDFLKNFEDWLNDVKFHNEEIFIGGCKIIIPKENL